VVRLQKEVVDVHTSLVHAVMNNGATAALAHIQTASAFIDRCPTFAEYSNGSNDFANLTNTHSLLQCPSACFFYLYIFHAGNVRKNIIFLFLISETVHLARFMDLYSKIIGSMDLCAYPEPATIDNWRDAVVTKLHQENQGINTEWHAGFDNQFRKSMDHEDYPTVLIDMIHDYLRPLKVWFAIGTSMGCKTVPNEDSKTRVYEYCVWSPSKPCGAVGHLHIYLEDLEHPVNNPWITDDDWEQGANSDIQLYVDGVTKGDRDYACYVHDIDLFAYWWSHGHPAYASGHDDSHSFTFCRQSSSNRISLTSLEFCL
jgi:hypothetical protein